MPMRRGKEEGAHGSAIMWGTMWVKEARIYDSTLIYAGTGRIVHSVGAVLFETQRSEGE